MNIEDLLHPQTLTAIELLKDSFGKPCVFTGPPGTMKLETATYLSEYWSDKTYQIAVDGKEAGIEGIRELRPALHLSHAAKRTVIINHADKLSREAQNSLLKILEEPPKDVGFILIAENKSALLPTIISRVQTVNFMPLPKVQFSELLLRRFPQVSRTEKDLLYYITGGGIGQAYELLEAGLDTAYFEAIKQLLASDDYQKIIYIESAFKDQIEAVRLCEYLTAIIRSALSASSAKNSVKLTRHWASKLEAAERARRLLDMNVNRKLVLSELMVQL